ncbi:MAG: transglycosylase domain-containing protein, partial [Acidimicrobiia bacterium]|nr:transglycosylase domain-containing protein [Acidimicrobiia bacterium]
MARLVRYLVVLLLAGALTSVTLVLAAPGLGAVLTAGEADPPEEIDLEPLAERSVVMAADGSRIGVLEAENRTSVDLAEVPDVVIDTVLAIEDRDFYRHEGVNLRATFRALLENVEAGEVEQGGSTITQQLVKNALLTPEQDLGRKIEEAVLARRLEDSMSKDEILERYLNTVFLGNRSYGIQAASKRYYDRPVQELGLAEAAFLAGLIRNPVGYDPIRRPEVARGRRDVVLDRLVELDELEPAAAELLKTVPVPTAVFDDRPPRDYFLDEVRRRLLQDERLGESVREREDLLLRGGLTIRTTLDPRLQQLAAQAMATQLPDTGGAFAGALASVDPATGAVRALIGGPGFDRYEYNIATQGVGQQPGSSFKPIVLAAALNTGLITPNDTIQGSSPCTFEVEDFPDQIGPEDWEVENYEGTRGGTGTIRSATARSLNCAYARLLLLIGRQPVIDMAKKLGITTDLQPNAAIALGSEVVYPLDMASVYGVFAADGLRHENYVVEEVLDRDGEVLLQQDKTPERVLTEDLARTVTDVLTGVVDGGGTGASASLGARPVAGKTGTSQESWDAWFVGYTPQLSTAVWMGSPEGNITMANVGGRARVTGGSFPAAIWKAYMQPALDGQPVVEFAEPPDPDRPGQYLA